MTDPVVIEDATIRPHRVEWVGDTNLIHPWRVRMRALSLPIYYTVADGEAMGLTPPPPAIDPLVVTCNGHSIELAGAEVQAFIWWWAHGNVSLPDLPQQNAAAIKLSHLLRDARQDPRPAATQPPSTADAALLADLDAAEADREPWYVTLSGPAFTSGMIVAGPFTTRDDALTARTAIEARSGGHTYWVRPASGMTGGAT